MASRDPKYDLAVYPMTMAVRSASDGAAVHTVHLPYCNCADFTNRKGRQTETADGAPAVTICKHIAAALERVGGWHREPGREAHSDLTDAAVKELLRSTTIGFRARESNALVHRAAHAAGLPVPFSASLTGALVDGLLTYDRLQDRYSLTVFR